MADDDAPPGVPEWVVTYGDMMSLLLTFFIMLVSMSEVKATKKYRQVLESLQQHLGYRSGARVPPGPYFPLNSMVEQLTTLGSFKDDPTGKGGVKAPQTVDGPDTRTLTNRPGVPIPVEPVLLFDTGSLVLDEAGQRAMEKIVAAVAGKPNKIEIRSHCAPGKPDTRRFQDNWQLTYARGHAVYELLRKAGVNPERVRIVACGEYQPPNSSADMRSLQADRVEVIMLDTYASDYIGPRDRAG